MDELLSNIKINVDDCLFLRDPDSSALGKKIIEYSISMIDEIGFEEFTFKKLGNAIGSPESTIYRYFENKQTLLAYLTYWYWAWLEYRLVFFTNNVSSPSERLKKAIDVITETIDEKTTLSHINEVKLNRIVVNESFKVYFTKEVISTDKKGFYHIYKRIIERVSEMILGVSPAFEYPHALATMLIEGSHQQKLFSKHLPLLTEIGEEDAQQSIFFSRMVFNMLKYE